MAINIGVKQTGRMIQNIPYFSQDGSKVNLTPLGIASTVSGLTPHRQFVSPTEVVISPDTNANGT